MKIVKEFAEMLNGRNYGSELSPADIKEAKELGFVIVYSAYDASMNLMRLDGAINYELGYYGGGTAYFDENGVFKNESVYSYEELKRYRAITINWGKGEYVWSYDTDIPHETFCIYENGHKYCDGIVFDIKSLNKRVNVPVTMV